MNDKILPIFERRLQKAQERLAFGMKPDVFLEGSLADVTIMKKYYGLSKYEEILLMPVFDELCLLENGSVTFGRIDDLWTIYDSRTGEELIDESFSAKPFYHQAHHTLEIVVDDQYHGLFDVNGKRQLLAAQYDEVDCSAAYSHLWVRKGKRWGYVNKITGEEVLVYDMDMAYEADGGLFLRTGNRIICIDERGVSDEHALRKFVISRQGRGVVRNAQYHVSVYFDIYGNIIN